MDTSSRLEEAGVVTDCSIRTQEADDTLDFNFCNTGKDSTLTGKEST